MNRYRSTWLLGSLFLIFTFSASSANAQQKGQWMPGQMGLNAGVMPDPGVSIANLEINYSSDTLNDRNGNKIPGISGSYNVWVVENILYYVPKFKFLGAKVGFMIAQPTLANGSIDLDLGNPPQFTGSAGGYGFADTYVQPVQLGWSLKRLDIYAAYSFFAPTGRYVPGASNNVGMGFWGNDFLTGTTLYITKNKATSASLFTDYEIHGSKEGSNNTHLTPGQAFTTEWGIGQILPLKKDFSRLLQLGAVGYDQWQVSDNGGTLSDGVTPASTIPGYAVHAAGLQVNYIMPAKALNLTFKYYWEYSAKARPIGNTCAFGITYTFRIPKPQPPAAPASPPKS
jgi:hypothetical protein